MDTQTQPADPALLVRRDNAAIAHVACLQPVNADEANLAAQLVAAGACAMECLQLAHEHRGDRTFFLRCSAQAAKMMREARATRALLQRVQAERRKLETDSTTAESAALTEHCALGLKMDALCGVQPAAIVEPLPPLTSPAPNPVRTNVKPAGSAADIAAEADQYARSHRKRAALIHALGRLPDRLDCGPLAPELVKAIVTGTSPVLRSLGQRAHAAQDAAT